MPLFYRKHDCSLSCQGGSLLDGGCEKWHNFQYAFEINRNESNFPGSAGNGMVFCSGAGKEERRRIK